MGFDSLMSLAESLEVAEKAAAQTKRPPALDNALALALSESEHPAVAEAWRSIEVKNGKHDILFPSLSVAGLLLEEEIHPQAVGHALVQACRGGHLLCVRRLREIMNENLFGSMLVGLFNAFALLKATEAGHSDVVEEILSTPIMSASTAMMGYMVASRWKDKDASGYPFVEPPGNYPSGSWMTKLTNAKVMLPAGGPIFQSGGWDMRGLPGLHENQHRVVRAFYTTYLLWRTSVVAASKCHAEVFRVLLNKRAADNNSLAEVLGDLEMAKGKVGLGSETKKIVADRAKLDTLMYQLVEEYSTKNYHDAMLYTLWGHIERGGRAGPSGPGAGNPRCVAQAQNGLWELQLEVPLLMMPVEHALQDEEPFRRYKQLTLLYPQKAKVNIQLLATVEAQPNFLQVTVGIKHVRFKAENSRWDEMCMGHFPSVVSLSVMPQTKEGTSVTMTNSSSNTSYKIGRAENFSLGTGANDGASRGLSGGIRASAGISMNSTMKATPWRFEQIPLADDRGGSFLWTLQSMKGIAFERSNPHRMAETNSRWNWARRVPGNPLDALPFTSEGGVIFAGNEFSDTLMWRFPKTMEGKKLRWSIEGQIHSTFTTSRYFETRMASFSGDIEERLQPLEDKKDKKDKDGKDGAKENKDKSEKGEKGDKTEKGEKGEKKEKGEKGEKKDKGEKGEKKDKGEKGEKMEKGEKGEKKEKGEKGEKKDKAGKEEKEEKESKPTPTLGKLNTTMKTEFLEWLEFKKYQEEKLRAAQAKTGDTHAEQLEEKTPEPEEVPAIVSSKPEEVEPVSSKPEELEPVSSKPEEVEPVSSRPEEVEPVSSSQDQGYGTSYKSSSQEQGYETSYKISSQDQGYGTSYKSSSQDKGYETSNWTSSEVSGTEFKFNKINLKLDEEELEFATSRVTLHTDQGMWIDSSDVDALSPPHQPMVGGPLRSIYEEDSYVVPDYIKARENSDSGRRMGRSQRTRPGQGQR